MSILCSTLFLHVVYIHHGLIHPLPSPPWYSLLDFSSILLSAGMTVLTGCLFAPLLSTYLKFSSSPHLFPPLYVLPSFYPPPTSHPYLSTPWPPIAKYLICFRGIFLKFISIFAVTITVPDPMNSSLKLDEKFLMGHWASKLSQILSSLCTANIRVSFDAISWKLYTGQEGKGGT